MRRSDGLLFCVIGMLLAGAVLAFAETAPAETPVPPSLDEFQIPNPEPTAVDWSQQPMQSQYIADANQTRVASGNVPNLPTSLLDGPAESVVERSEGQFTIHAMAVSSSKNDVTAEKGIMTKVVFSPEMAGADKYRRAVVRVRNSTKQAHYLTVVWPDGRSRLLLRGQSIAQTIRKKDGEFVIYLQNSHAEKPADASISVSFQR